jgi:hypothetical protein
MYKQLKKYNFETKQFDGLADAIIRLADTATIPFAPDNTDYQTFKKEVLVGAELKDADGNTMTTEEANAFIETLP